MRRVLIAALAAASILLAPRAAASCDLALVLTLDASGSFSARDWTLTVDAHIEGLRSDRVMRLAETEGMKIAIVAFADEAATVLPLTPVRSDADMARVIAAFEGIRTRNPEWGSYTATGDALLRGLSLLAGEGSCTRHLIDLATDGQSNMGARPSTARDIAESRGVGINVVALRTSLGGEDPAEWAREHVVTRGSEHPDRGWVRPGFVVEADSIETWARAVVRKMIVEVADAR